jgi:uncharacterized protein (TIGR04222 family)
VVSRAVDARVNQAANRATIEGCWCPLPVTTAPQPTVSLARPDLQKRLREWSLDPPDARLSFAGTLARENGWSARHAERVIAEYRRFLYLAVAAGHPVCPSDAVDQAWHQHLLDSQGYWQEFCPRVLRQPLHHSPSRGRHGERERLGEDYRRTLESYASTFGELPPADIWPGEAERFSCRRRWRRVDASRCWILPVPRLAAGWWRGSGMESGRPRWIGHRLGLWAVLVALGLGVSGCAAYRVADPFNPFAWSGPEFLLFYGLLSAASVALVKEVYSGLGGGLRRPPADPDLSPLELAYLAGHEAQALKTAFLSLLQAGHVSLVSGMVRLGKQPPPLLPPLEAELVRVLKTGWMSTPFQLTHSIEKDKRLFAPLLMRLAELGLMCSRARMAAGKCCAAVVMGGVWVLGAKRLQLGLAAGRPVGFLFIAMLLVTVGSILLLATTPSRTRRGEQLIHQRKQHVEQKRPLLTATSPDLLCAFALLGWEVLPASLASDMEFARVNIATENTDGCGAGSSGGCGGGCGGCGGCGG